MDRNDAKREARKTWKALHLESHFRTKLQRSKAEKGGLYRVIGGDVPQRPYLKVPRHRYVQVRETITRQVVNEIGHQLGNNSETIRTVLQSQIEIKTYEALAREYQADNLRPRSVSKAALALTDEEHRHLLQAARPEKSGTKGRGARMGAIDEVLSRVTETQKDNPERLQEAWSRTVGIEIAGQTKLERVDTTQGIAYFRCYNSGLSFTLQRQPGLAVKLGRELKIKLKQIRVQY